MRIVEEDQWYMEEQEKLEQEYYDYLMDEFYRKIEEQDKKYANQNQ